MKDFPSVRFELRKNDELVDIERIVIFDTCNLIDLVTNRNKKTDTLKGISKIFASESLVVITEFTLAEIILGSKTVEHLYNNSITLDECCFNILYFDKNIIDHDSIINIKDEKQLKKLHKRVLYRLIKKTFPLFITVFRLHNCFIIESLIDNKNKYYSKAIDFVQKIESNLKYKNILFDYHKKTYHEKKINNMQLYNLFKQLFIEEYKNEINIMELENTFPNDIDIKTIKKFLLNYFDYKNINSSDSNEIYIQLLRKIRTLYPNNCNAIKYGYLDACIYIVLKNIFINRKYDKNDWVDILNISTCYYESFICDYITSDNNWKRFIEIINEIK